MGRVQSVSGGGEDGVGLRLAESRFFRVQVAVRMKSSFPCRCQRANGRIVDLGAQGGCSNE